MNSLKIFGWISIVALLLFSSCREDNINNNEGDPQYQNPIIKVVSSVKGRIIDEDNLPVHDVIVKINGTQAISDKNGVFLFTDNELNQNGTLVTAEKSGYYLGAEMINPELGKESYTEIQLLTKDLTGNFNTNTGGTITTADNASVTFAPSSIMYENGTAFTGTVNVYMKWLDPTHARIGDRMPGDLRAIDAEDNPVQLATYGMLAVELESSTGLALQIKTGSEATISLPVPTEILAQAPNSIPLWSFDEETGYWIEESTATLQDGQYVGNVTHFSFWNCDAPFPIVNLCGSVVDSEGNPITEGSLAIDVDGIGTRYGYINEGGTFKGDVPLNTVMTIRYINLCGETTYEAEIGPFSNDVILDPIVGTTATPITLTGVLVQCDGSPVTNGYVFIEREYGTNIIYVEDDGSFNVDVYICEAGNIFIQGYDIDNLLQSDPLEIIPTPGETSVDIGNINACDVISEIIRIQVPELGVDKYIFNGYYGYDSTSSLEGINIGLQDTLSFSIQILANSMETGNIDVASFYFFGEDPGLPNNGIYLECYDTTCPQASVTNNGGPGERFTANFTADLIPEGETTAYEVIMDIDILLND